MNREAIHMRDATKIVALRQEHAAQTATKSRTKLAFEFRNQVEDHKIELERLERKLLTTSKQNTFWLGKCFHCCVYFQLKRCPHKAAWNH